LFRERIKEANSTITDAISQSVAHTAIALDVAAIVTPTESGYTAKMIAKYRPKSPIVAVSFDERVCRKLALVWGVQAYLAEKVYSTDELLETAIQTGVNAGFINFGDTVVITAGVPVGEAGTTNLMKIHVVGEQLVKGQGIGRKSAKGKAVVAKTAAEALEKMTEGDILVTTSTDKDMMPAIEKASALVIEEGGLTSHAAVVGVSIGIPVIVGVQNATSAIEHGQEITIDAARGIVYNGHAIVL
jgi:pyruvate kinase